VEVGVVCSNDCLKFLQLNADSWLFHKFMRVQVICSVSPSLSFWHFLPPPCLAYREFAAFDTAIDRNIIACIGSYTVLYFRTLFKFLYSWNEMCISAPLMAMFIHVILTPPDSNSASPLAQVYSVAHRVIL
jgi:hypothetical protein